MKLVELGKTGLKVTPICIGSWQLAGPVSYDGKPDGHPDPGSKQAIRLISSLVDLGLNFIDTAEQYGVGEGEVRVGKAIKGRRQNVVISSKFGYRVSNDGQRVANSDHNTILKSLEGSLRRLNTDYIDVYLYHCPPKDGNLEEAKNILDRAVQAGKIRSYGASTANFDFVKQLHQLEMAEGIQYPSSLLQPNQAIYDFCSQRGIGLQVRGVMAQGRLSGKHVLQGPTHDPDDNRIHKLQSRDYTRFSKLLDLLPANTSLASIAIYWAMKRSGNHSVCLGAKKYEEYEAACRLLERDEVEESLLDAVSNWIDKDNS